MTPQRILLAGATGAVGSELLRWLRARGFFVRALSRSPENAARIREIASEVVLADVTRPEELAGACEGIEVVVSCLGANVSLSLRERRGFRAIDLAGNTNLLEAARRAGVQRFVYLSAHPAPGYDHTRYMQAHLEMEERIRASGLSFSFVRPTGIFTALGDMIPMARSGVGSVPGDGRAKANPVHPVDVAEALADVLFEGPLEVAVGGPDVLTREDIMRLAFEALGKKPRIVHVPAAVFRSMSVLLAPVHPRLSEMLEFVAAVTTSDSVAPVRGTRRLRAWFESLGAG
jgi:uncharacterized protein YbjT (DUF2867 family)